MHAITPLPAWAARRAAMANVFSSVDPSRTALLVIDLQNAFLASGRFASVTFGLPIIPNVNRMIAGARASDVPVIFLRHTFADTPGRGLPAWQSPAAAPLEAVRRQMTIGDPGHDLYPALEVRSGDVIIDKYRQSAFTPKSSRLEETLRERHVDTVIISGAMTNACCEATARDASALGFRVFFLADATAALSDEEHNASLLNVALCCGDVRTTDAMLDLLSPRPATAP